MTDQLSGQGERLGPGPIPGAQPARRGHVPGRLGSPELVRQGLRNRDIASELGVTEGTVKVYLHAIFDKMGVDNRTELAMRAPELLGLSGR